MTERSGHGVPSAANDQTAAVLRATPNLVGEPTDAERSRTLVAASTFASLATMSTECPGFPFGSLVGYASDASGRLLLCLSSLAEHSRNMAADARASIMVTAADDGSDPLAQARVTLVGEMAKLEGDERQAGMDRYLAAHPTAFYISFSDFSVYRLEVANVRYVGGFGRMSWVSAADYAGAEPDPLAGAPADRVIEHMNADHADALLAYVRVFGRVEASSARLVGVDRYGLDVMALAEGETKRAVRVVFTESADTTDAVRAQTVALLREARAQLSG